MIVPAHRPPFPATIAASADWSALLLQGAGAALIGFLGLFAIYKLTQRTDRKRERIKRSAESVALVVEATHAYAFAGIDESEWHRRTVEATIEFTRALTLFAAREIADNEEAARWGLEQAKRAAELAFAGELHEADDEKNPALFAGRVGATLMRWLKDGAPTHTFNTNLAANRTDI